jgi:hypothetical protein
LQNEIKERKKESKWYHVILDGKRQTMDSMKKELIRFRNLINDTRNSKDYQKIEKIAEEKVNATLQDKKVMLVTALLSVLKTLRKNILTNNNSSLPTTTTITTHIQYYSTIHKFKKLFTVLLCRDPKNS